MEKNKIYLGNAYELIKEIESNSIDLIVTDPPYIIDGIHGAGLMKERINPYTIDLKNNKLDSGFDLSILNDFVRVLKKINIYIWCNKEQIIDYLDYFVKGKKCNWEVIIWCKTDAIPFCGTHYLKDKEYCLYFWEQGAPVNVPYERAKTVYTTKRNVYDKNDFGHPTIKPIEFIETFIKNSTKDGAIVLDPFVGSGTTCLAAKHLGLSYIGFEINENYYQIAKDRLQGINQKGEMNLFDI